MHQSFMHTFIHFIINLIKFERGAAVATSVGRPQGGRQADSDKTEEHL
jgi:hypothetical protein